MLEKQLAWRCAQHVDPAECPDALVGYFPKRRTFGLYVHDGGASFIRIAHCPWCGVKLTKVHHAAASSAARRRREGRRNAQASSQ
jgi:hypothetical protein